MELYKEDVRDERNIQPLSDDYIKFIRFAHWKIDKAGEGVIGMITNNSYLSGLIHRGMRKKLFESFNEIYILNLHGNSRIGEKCPDGSKDENVFDIMQGVSIILLIKDKEQQAKKRIFYQDVFGLRENKYKYLNKYDVTSTKWLKLQPTEPHYFFVVKDFTHKSGYDMFWKIPDIFIEWSSGVQTKRDRIAVSLDKNIVRKNFAMFCDPKIPDEMITQTFNLTDTYEWNLRKAREESRNDNPIDLIKCYSYRPFDQRFVYYSDAILARTFKRVMQHFSKENLGLVTTRKVPEIFGVPAFICNKIGDIHFISDQTYFFPLYLYPEKEKSKKHSGSIMMVFEPKAEYETKQPNINQALIEQLTNEFKKTPTPEQIFYYIYGVLYSNAYRTKYAEFLKIDFPRIPFTNDYKLFIKTGEFGQRLADLHLLKSDELDKSITKLNGKGDFRVEKVRYENGNVFINKDQYFDDIKPEVWEYQIGGYQVCDKWLKDRKDMLLSADDIKHYCQIVAAIQKTIQIQSKIDDFFPQVEKSLIEFKK
jgi:predicted helicase